MIAAGIALAKRFWPVLAVIALCMTLWGVVAWHSGKVSDAYTAAFNAGAAQQKAADEKAVATAERAATKLQADLKAATATNAAAISKGTDDALKDRYTVLARSYDDLRMRWAANRAAEGGAGKDAATGLAGAAGIPDAAYCPSQGWVSLDVAATAAEAADTAIAKDDAWREWWTAQQAAWPK